MDINFSLKTAILKSGLKQRFIASIAKIDQTRFSKIIHGHVEPMEEEKYRIAKAIGIEKSKLFKQPNMKESN